VRGTVVLLHAALNELGFDGSRIRAEAGVASPKVSRFAAMHDRADAEFLSGIPGTIGGAVAMNAGTREGSTFDHLVSLTVVDGQGRLANWGKDQFHAVYRDGNLGRAIALQATFELRPDDPQAIFTRFSQSLKKRNATQPVSQRSVGCVFRNPPGDAAGRLIEAAGCKLLKVGGIEVSALHANYFVNSGTGTCQDFLNLMQEVQKRVQDHSGLRLEPEVKIWGI
jgi:UDP-N-acetylmuramate dehydrogenase